MSQPRVSVVIPTYNRGHCILNAIDSVLEQSFDDLEIVVVDDCSTDNTKEVLQALSDPRVRYLRHANNRKGSAARNTGIQAAKGELIAFLDSDDIWLPGKLDKQVNEFEQAKKKYPDEHRIVIYSKLTLKTPISSVDIPQRAPRHDETIRSFITSGRGVVSIITVLTTTEFAREILFDELLAVNQDGDFAMRMDAAGGRFFLIEEPLAVWLRGANDHVSSSSDYQSGLDWLQRNPDLLTDKEATRIRAVTFAHQAIRAGARKEALTWGVQGVLKGVVRPREILELTTAVALPVTYHNQLWALLRKLRHSIRS